MPQTGVRTNIFGIGEVYELQRDGLWVEKNRESYREYGYFGGGFFPFSGFSTVDRIDYSNDTATASVRGPLTAGGYKLSATGNSNFGYYTSLSTIGVSSLVNRIDYSNDSSTASVRGPISRNVGGSLAATGNSNFGYFAGGPVTTMDRIDYSNDLATSLQKGNLILLRTRFSAVGNSNFGYFGGGGISNANTSEMQRITYSNDSVVAVFRGPLTVATDSSASTGNSNFGYFGGRNTSATQRINYANDLANSQLRGNLLHIRWGFAATGNSNFGYFDGGFPGTRSTLERIDYSNDTATAQFRGNLTNSLLNRAATSSASFGGAPVSYLGAPWTATSPFGYFGGGVSPGPNLSTVDRIDYSNDTNTASVRGSLSISKYEPTGVSNNNFGYFGGGASPAVLSTVDRIDYSNDTNAVSVRGSLSIARETRATGNYNFGYFGGGTPGPVSTVDRIDYSNDTATALSKSVLTASRYRHNAVGNINFGYFMGGRTPSPPPYFSTVDRIDYSNDTATASVRGPLSNSISNFAATGNNNFGYTGGGAPTSSTVNRIDYSNDTAAASVRGPLANSRECVATGNSNFGYFGLGFNGAVNFSNLHRVDYSNDTQIAQIRSFGSLERRQLGTSSSQAFGGAPNTTTDPLPVYIRDATKFNDSNTLDLPFKRVLGSYGYFGGGDTGGTIVSRIDRIDYSNDTSTASIRGPLGEIRSRTASTGTSNYGYIAMGRSGIPSPRKTSYQRIDYSNDTAISIIKTGGFNKELVDPAATGNSNFGYFAGGNDVATPSYSFISRLDYSADNDSPLVRALLSQNTYILAATGNSNFGYFGGGLTSPSPYYSTVNRLNYSNDTATASVRGALSIERGDLSATGNSNFGYFGGGRNPGVPAFYSTVDRIDYSNDTATASVRGPLSSSVYSSAATGNSNFGYFGGGRSGSLSTVDRVNYSNDTATASVRGPLSQSRYALAATTNARNS